MLKRLAGYFAASRVGDEPLLARTDVDAAPLLRGAADALTARKLDEALRLVNEVLQNHHDLAPAHLLQGRILHQRGEFDDARDSYTLAICFDPKSWSSHFNLGVLALDQERFEQSATHLVKAIELGGDEAQVHNQLGAAYLRLGKFEDAVVHLKRAISLQADLVEAHSNLGYVLFRELEEFESGARHIETALALSPTHRAALCNWTMVLLQRGEIEEAVTLCDRLLSQDPMFDEARLNRALILLTKGEFARAWPEYESRKQSGSACFARGPSCADWDGSPLTGKTLFVQSEQGIGDEMMFASCLPELITAGATCIVECSSKLEPLFRRSFAGAVVVKKDEWADSRAIRQRPPDWKVALGSLPRFLRNRSTDFPPHKGYLKADPMRVAYWRDRIASLPGKMKVGISWRGGAKSTRGGLRSVPLHQWLPILQLPNIAFVSLQYTECAQELAQLRQLGVQIEHWQDAIDDYAETAALVSALDLVVSVQTAVVHLAGALGTPVWALISAVPEWRYGGHGETMPWYPSARLVRQIHPGEWAPVIRRVQTELSAWARAAD